MYCPALAGLREVRLPAFALGASAWPRRSSAEFHGAEAGRRTLLTCENRSNGLRPPKEFGGEAGSADDRSEEDTPRRRMFEERPNQRPMLVESGGRAHD